MTKKIKAPTLKSRAEFEEIVDRLAEASVALRALESIRDAKLQLLRDEHDPAITALQAEIEGMLKTTSLYAAEHRKELLPGETKSADTSLATYGFRYGNRTLKLLNSAWTWENVVAALKRKRLGRFIRVSYEADKDALKDKMPEKRLAAIGCKVTQKESFFVDPKEQPSAT